VDDTPIGLYALCSLLRTESCAEVVGTGANGAEGIRRVESLEPDLLVMDLEMPVLGGLEAAKEVRARFPRTRIVLTSMHDGANWHSLSRESGVDGFVPKQELNRKLLPLIKRLFADRKESFE
jgi:DNA-binding NarL/FixJ family response regulator